MVRGWSCRWVFYPVHCAGEGWKAASRGYRPDIAFHRAMSPHLKYCYIIPNTALTQLLKQSKKEKQNISLSHKAIEKSILLTIALSRAALQYIGTMSVYLLKGNTTTKFNISTLLCATPFKLKLILIFETNNNAKK